MGADLVKRVLVEYQKSHVGGIGRRLRLLLDTWEGKISRLLGREGSKAELKGE